MFLIMSQGPLNDEVHTSFIVAGRFVIETLRGVKASLQNGCTLHVRND